MSEGEGSKKEQNKGANPLLRSAGVALILAVIFGGMYLLFVKGSRQAVEVPIGIANGGYDLLKRAGKDIYRALKFEPKVTINGEVVYEPSSGISEIATATRNFTYTHSYESKWLGSTKRLELKGEFTAKAGFELGDSFRLNISEEGDLVVLEHKEPQVLSCELTKLTVLDDSNGLWNKLKTDDREDAQNELLQRARAHAMNEDLKEAASANLLERLQPLEKEFQFKAESKVFQ